MRITGPLRSSLPVSSLGWVCFWGMRSNETNSHCAFTFRELVTICGEHQIHNREPSRPSLRLGLVWPEEFRLFRIRLARDVRKRNSFEADDRSKVLHDAAAGAERTAVGFRHTRVLR